MLFKSQVYTQASGSVGGLTYSRSPSGMYTRARAVPVNPQTQRQNNVRNALAMYSQMWLTTLTQVQRDGWDLYGRSVSLINRLGDTFLASGQNHYIRANVPRTQVNMELAPAVLLDPINDAPTTFDLPTLAAPFALSGTPGAGLLFTFDNTEPWVNDEQNTLLIYQGRPRNQSRKFFKGPYRLVGEIRGDAGTPPISPTILATGLDGYPTAVGQLEKIKFVLSVGAPTNQPTGRSIEAYAEAILA